MAEIQTISLLRSPCVVYMGLNSIQKVAEETRSLGGHKALIISDPGVYQAGLVEKVKEMLESDKIDCEVYYNVEPEPSIATVDQCTEFAVETGADIIVAVGGGSAIDVAKSTAVCAKKGVSIRDYLGMDNVPGPGLPKIIIPTTAGSGSEASMAVVLTDQIDKTKKTAYSRYLLADTAIVDPIMTLTMPPHVTAETGVDALSHAIEAFVSVRANSFSDALALEAIRLIGGHLKKAYANGNDLRAREKMAEASLLAGFAFSCSGLGAIHALAYPFTTFYGHSHGKANGIVMPGVMRFNCIANEEKFKLIAEALGAQVEGLSLRESALHAAEVAETLLNDVGIDTKISNYGIPKEKISYMAKQAVEANARLLVSNPRRMNVRDAEEIYLNTY